MSKQEKERVVYWEREAETNPSARFEVIAHFDARGKHRVYGRSDHFGKLALKMDVWQTKDGRLLVRVWSCNDEIDWCSYEIVGLSIDNLSHDQAAGFGEHWIPECLREEYEDWVVSGIQ